jgi:hypothetical protein
MKDKSTKRTQRVTMSLPVELLAFADLEADAVGMDRYDVIRGALAMGLTAMRAQRALLEDPERYKDSLRAFLAGQPGAQEKFGDELAEGAIDSLRRQTGRTD